MTNVFRVLLFVPVWLQASSYCQKQAANAFAAWPHAFTTNTDTGPQISSFQPLTKRIGLQGSIRGSSYCPHRQAAFASTLKAIHSADSHRKDLRHFHGRTASYLPSPSLFLRQEQHRTAQAAAKNLPIASADDGSFGSKKTQSCDYTTLCALAAELQVSYADFGAFSMPFWL
jgi:hypothetical protein